MSRCIYCQVPLPAGYENDRECSRLARGSRGEVYACASSFVRSVEVSPVAPPVPENGHGAGDEFGGSDF